MAYSAWSTFTSRSSEIFQLLVIQFVCYLLHQLKISYDPPFWWKLDIYVHFGEYKVILLIGHFWVQFSPYFKASLREKSLIWISVFVHFETRTNCHNKNFPGRLFEKDSEENLQLIYSPLV